MTILIFIIILGLLVFVHEFGHFFVARRHGVKAEEFGFGFPPRMIGVWRDEKGKFHSILGNKELRDIPSTVYSLNWLPLGGFVKIKGEGGEHASDKDSFAAQAIWRRGTILLAGVLMNLLLTVFLLFLGFTTGMPQSLDGVEPGARVRNQKIEIVSVVNGSPASRAGLQAGDTVLQLDNVMPKDAEGLRAFIAAHEAQEIRIRVRRDSEEKDFIVRPAVISDTGKAGLGVFLLDTGIVSYPWYVAIWKSFLVTGFLIQEIIFSFGALIKNLLVTGKVAVDLSGPVGIAVLTGRVARLGFAYLVQFTALLSINLAILNALPIPALDGGRFLFLIIEKFRGKPVSKKVENIIHNIGFILLLLLVLVVTYRDLLHFEGSILDFFKR